MARVSSLPGTCIVNLCLSLQDLAQDELVALTKRTQDGGTEVVQAKAGKVRTHDPLQAKKRRIEETHASVHPQKGSIGAPTYGHN